MKNRSNNQIIILIITLYTITSCNCIKNIQNLEEATKKLNKALNNSLNKIPKEIKTLNKQMKMYNKIIYDLNSEYIKQSVSQKRKLVHQDKVIHQDAPSLLDSSQKKYTYKNLRIKRSNIIEKSINETLFEMQNNSSEFVWNEDDWIQYYEFIKPKAWTWFIIILYVIVFFVGLIGNVLVGVAVYRNYTMRTVTNYFIVNLAVADFLVILFCLPPSIIWSIYLTWFFGKHMCKIVTYLQTVSVSVSVLTLTFISIDRWQAICYPLKFKSNTRRATKSIAIIWTFSIIFDIPELISYDTETKHLTQCVSNWSTEMHQYWIILKIVLLYLVPLIFMAFAYTSIIRVLWKSGLTTHRIRDSSGNQHSTFIMASNTSTLGQLRSRKKAARMLVSVVVMFAVCYFPVHLQCILRLFIQMQNSESNIAFVMLAQWLCYANSAVNPVIYNFMSGKFRRAFRRTIGCCSTESNPYASEMNNVRRGTVSTSNSTRVSIRLSSMTPRDEISS